MLFSMPKHQPQGKGSLSRHHEKLQQMPSANNTYTSAIQLRVCIRKQKTYSCLIHLGSFCSRQNKQNKKRNLLDTTFTYDRLRNYMATFCLNCLAICIVNIWTLSKNTVFNKSSQREKQEKTTRETPYNVPSPLLYKLVIYSYWLLL